MRHAAVAAFLLLAAALFAQDQELQCKCRHIEADEYLCKCIASKGAVPSSLTIPAPASAAAASAAAIPAVRSASSTATPPAASGAPTGERTASGAPIYVGPRGGRYHYSSSGKKVYERRRK